MTNYDINDIESLSFREGVRSKIAMYLGSADMMGVYNAIQEIISNSIDEFYMGYGDRIEITLEEDNTIIVRDYGRGVPFGIKEDGSNVLVDIFSRAHTGGKFNQKVYSGVAGTNGIGAKATCLSSDYFMVESYRDGETAYAKFNKGLFHHYWQGKDPTRPQNGTKIVFKPDSEVYNLEPVNVEFEVLCEKCRNLSYLTKGLEFVLEYKAKVVVYCAKNGLQDLVRENSKNSLHSVPIYFKLVDGNEEAEVALQWTTGKEQSYTFTNGLFHSEGGSSQAGVKMAITNFMKKYVSGESDGDLYRTGLIYAVNCKTPTPSFANQTKTKINNPSLRGLAQRATTQALTEFATKHKAEFDRIIECLNKMRKAETAAANARQKVLDATKNIEQNQKRKVFASDKLKDAENLGEDSILLLVEGNSAAASMAVARDVKKYGILALRGKMINCLANSDEDIYENEEIKLLLSALNIVPGKYNSKKLRYGKVAITVDGDSDGSHIGLLVMSALQHLAPEFIQEKRLFWLRSPLWIVKNGKSEKYYFTDAEMDAARGSVSGTIQRNKGLGSLDASQARNSMFSTTYQRLDPIVPNNDAINLLYELMGPKAELRTKFIQANVDFREIKE